MLSQALDKIKGPLKAVVYWGTSNPDAHQVTDHVLSLLADSYSRMEYVNQSQDQAAKGLTS